jgi:hypothetical protein
MLLILCHKYYKLDCGPLRCGAPHLHQHGPWPSSFAPGYGPFYRRPLLISRLPLNDMSYRPSLHCSDFPLLISTMLAIYNIKCWDKKIISSGHKHLWRYGQSHARTKALGNQSAMLINMTKEISSMWGWQKKIGCKLSNGQSCSKLIHFLCQFDNIKERTF